MSGLRQRCEEAADKAFPEGEHEVHCGHPDLACVCYASPILKSVADAIERVARELAEKALRRSHMRDRAAIMHIIEAAARGEDE